MIDYIKLDVTHVGLVRLEEAGLNFVYPGNFNPETGEMVANKWSKADRIAEYNGLRFSKYKSGKIYLTGSLHKYSNQGRHNYDQFTLEKLMLVIRDLESRFGINLYKASIHHIEYGVNLYGLPWDATQIVQNVMLHCGKGIKPLIFQDSPQQTPSNYKTIRRKCTIIKIYNKGIQYDLKENILRIERKDRKMRELNQLGIKFLGDLHKFGSMEILLKRLLNHWDGVIINDWTVQIKSFNQVQKLKDWSNTKFWINLYNQSRSKNRNKFSREMNNYLGLVQDNSDRIHHTIREAIQKTWCKNTTIDQIAEISQQVQEPLYIIDAPAPTLNRVCKITGIDISNQKGGSYYLRESTIERIYSDDPVLYQLLKSEFGPKKKQILTLKAEFEAIAKNIRNRDSNPRKREREAVNKYNNSLFPYEPSIPLFARS